MPNPNEVMDVETELRDYICKRYTKPYDDMRQELRNHVDEMVRIAIPFVAQQNATLLRSILNDPLFKACNGCSCDAASILEAKLNEITKEVI